MRSSGSTVLEELAVANLGVITEARIEPGPGLVVVSGETGAGKTLLLGALRLLTGGQAAGDRIGPHGDEARAEARFAREDGEEVVVARRVVAGGRSRAYLNGAMAPARALAAATAALVEMVGQHDAHALTRPGDVRRLVDGALDGAGEKARRSYAEAWEQLTRVEAARQEVGGDRKALERERDLVRYQTDEIAAAGFGAGEDAELRSRAARLRNAEALAAHLSAALAGLDDEVGAGAGLGAAWDELRRAARLDGELAGFAERAGEVTELLAELAADLRRRADEPDHDPQTLQQVEARLAVLAGLQRKYGDTLDEVLAFGEEAAQRAAELDALLERAGGIDAELEAARREVAAAGAALAVARRTAGARLATAAVEHLAELGFRRPVVEVDVTDAHPGPAGADRVALLFASDESLTPGAAARVASGGELTRLVLALRLAGGIGEAPVVVFDEVDAGVGGATALALGRKLAALAAGRQVLCVTHLPQVAAFADAHFVVERAGAAASVRRVAGPERVAELSRMLAGMPESDRGRDHAEELLALAGKA